MTRPIRCMLLAAAALLVGPGIVSAQVEPEEAGHRGAADAPLRMVELARTTLPSVIGEPRQYRLLHVRIPAAETARYTAPPGMIYLLSGLQTVGVDGSSRLLEPGDGMAIAGGVEAAYGAVGTEPSEYLHFVLAPLAEAELPLVTAPATAAELFHGGGPLPGLVAGAYDFDLSVLEFAPGMPRNDPHYRTGAALYFVLTGAGEFTTGATSERIGAGRVVLEPHGLVHQWANPGDAPVVLVVANISPAGGPAFEFVGR